MRLWRDLHSLNRSEGTCYYIQKLMLFSCCLQKSLFEMLQRVANTVFTLLLTSFCFNQSWLEKKKSSNSHVIHCDLELQWIRMWISCYSLVRSHVRMHRSLTRIACSLANSFACQLVRSTACETIEVLSPMFKVFWITVRWASCCLSMTLRRGKKESFVNHMEC